MFGLTFDWRELFQVASDFVNDHWLKMLTIGLVAVVTAGWGRWQLYRAWKRREFLKRVNLSLNMVIEDTLKIRTMFEMPIEAILLNAPDMVNMVLKAARRTKPGEPLLNLPERDAWLVLNAVLNEISERFAPWFVLAEMGGKVERGQFVICLTCEKDRDVRLQKIRIMMVRRETLEGIASAPMPKFESQSHRVRWETLKAMGLRYHVEKKRGEWVLLMPLEILVPKGELG